MRPVVLPALCAWALFVALPAGAHVDPEGILVADGRSSLGLTAHNDRDEPMTGFRAALPAGLTVVEAPPPDGWEASVAGSDVSWASGDLAAAEDETFVLELEGSLDPGPVEIAVEQLYPDGDVVPWTVAVTAVPGPVEDSGGVRWSDLLVVAALGLLTVAAILAIRRSRTVAER